MLRVQQRIENAVADEVDEESQPEQPEDNRRNTGKVVHGALRMTRVNEDALWAYSVK